MYSAALNHKSKVKTEKLPWGGIIVRDLEGLTLDVGICRGGGGGQHYIYSSATCSARVKAIVTSVCYDAETKATHLNGGTEERIHAALRCIKLPEK